MSEEDGKVRREEEANDDGGLPVSSPNRRDVVNAKNSSRESLEKVENTLSETDDQVNDDVSIMWIQRH